MKSAANKPTHVTRGNVLDDLGFSPERRVSTILRQVLTEFSEFFMLVELAC